MSEKRKCVNCRHNIRKEKPSGNIECVCEITNEHIGYVKCFEGWCRHWAKQKDGKEAKMLVVDEIHTNQGGFYKLPNGAYAHYSCGVADQLEEIEAKSTVLENTEIAKSFEQALRKHWERIKNGQTASED
jgi:hypothetical protein